MSRPAEYTIFAVGVLVAIALIALGLLCFGGAEAVRRLAEGMRLWWR